MDADLERGNLKIPEMFTDWLATIGARNLRLPFLDELSCGGCPNVQTMWSLTAQRCSELPLTSLSTICRIKARCSCLSAEPPSAPRGADLPPQPSVPSIRSLFGVRETCTIEAAEHSRQKRDVFGNLQFYFCFINFACSASREP